MNISATVKSAMFRAAIVLTLVLAVVPRVSVVAESSSPRLNTVFGIPEDLENQEIRIIEVVLAPGEASPPHRHNAHVYVYMLEGEVEMQVRGGILTHLKPGDVFYESPADIHQVGRNLSNTEPAKFLVHMLKKTGAPVSIPVTD